MTLTDSDRESLQSDLSDLLGQHVRVESGECSGDGGAQLSIVEISYRSDRHSAGRSTSSTLVRQTILYSKDVELDLPPFTLSPTIKGVAGKLLSLFGEMGDIDFEDSPLFSSAYHLHGWSEKPVRLLFSEPIRDYFSSHRGWNLVGKGNRLGIYRHNVVSDGQSREQFVGEALEMLSLFQQSEEQLDAMGDVPRETTGDDMIATAERMGGIAGSLLANQLRKNSVTRSDVEDFARQSPPRNVPPGLAKQVVGDNLMLVFLGAIFCVGGLVGGTLVVTLAEGSDRWIGLSILIVFPTVGGLIMGLTLRHRSRAKRTLQSGTLVEARVTSVTETSVTINNQRRYHVVIQWEGQGQTKQLKLNTYGPQVYQARNAMENDQTLRVLVDPHDPSHGVAIDLLMVIGD